MRKFGRKRNQRKALLKSLAVALILRGKIKTSAARAKDLRRFAERLVPYAQNQSPPLALREIPKFINKTAAKKLVKDIAPKYKERQGGYTRIIKAGRRAGDAAETAYIEFI